MQQVADEMSSAWGVHVRCEHVDMSGALQELVSAGVMPDSAVKVCQVRAAQCVKCVGMQCDGACWQSSRWSRPHCRGCEGDRLCRSLVGG
jgi:hypothetical protein